MANEDQEFKYINPMIDYGFKKIFKESGRKELLIRPLNAIFGLDISDLEIGESEQLGETPDDRNASFDLYCTASDGKRFIVEVQLARQEYFLQRALYYASFPITRSARKGGGAAANRPAYAGGRFIGRAGRGMHGPPRRAGAGVARCLTSPRQEKQ